MKRSLFFLIVLFSGLSIKAQVPKWEWAKADGAAKISNSPSHVIAATHNKVLWGELINKKMIYSPNVLGNHKISEYDSAGNFLNSITITGKFHLLDAKADNAGNWYVLGQYFDTVTFSPTLQYVRDPFTFPTGSDYFMFRLNAGSLSLAWAQHIGSNTYSTASAFTIANNSLYIVIDSVTTYINKLDLATGARTVLWPQTGFSRVSSIAADNAGNVYLAGNCSHDTISFNGHVETVPFSYNSYIVRYKANGNFDWVQWMDDITCNARTITLATNNLLYYTGPLNDSLVLDGHHLSKPVGYISFMAARLDSSGHANWVRQSNDTTTGSAGMSTMYNAAVTEDSCLNIFLTIRGAINLGNGIISALPTTTTNAAIVCIKPDNTTKWVKYVRGGSTNTNHIISTGKDLYVTGGGNDSTALRFDTIATAVTIGGYTPYIAKINAIEHATDTTSHGSYVSSVNTTNITIAPNPATKQVSILGLENVKGIVTMRMTDVYGKVLLTQTYETAHGREMLHVDGYARGVYFLELNGQNLNTIQKIILQ